MTCDWQKRESSDRRMLVLEQSQQQVNDQRLNDYKHAVIRFLPIIHRFVLVNCAFIIINERVQTLGCQVGSIRDCSLIVPIKSNQIKCVFLDCIYNVSNVLE